MKSRNLQKFSSIVEAAIPNIALRSSVTKCVKYIGNQTKYSAQAKLRSLFSMSCGKI
jgi:hypothetical protein